MTITTPILDALVGGEDEYVRSLLTPGEPYRVTTRSVPDAAGATLELLLTVGDAMEGGPSCLLAGQTYFGIDLAVHQSEIDRRMWRWDLIARGPGDLSAILYTQEERFANIEQSEALLTTWRAVAHGLIGHVDPLRRASVALRRDLDEVVHHLRALSAAISPPHTPSITSAIHHARSHHVAV